MLAGLALTLLAAVEPLSAASEAALTAFGIDVWSGGGRPDWRFALLYETLFFALAAALVLAWALLIERRPLGSIGLRRCRFAPRGMLWLVAGFAWSTLFTLVVAAASGEPALALGYLRRPGAAAAALLLVAPIVLVAVVAEEVLWRGWALAAFSERIGLVPAAAVTALLFAATHVYPNGWADPARLASLATYIATGAVFTVIAVRQGHLYGAIAFHAGYNICWRLEDLGGFGFDPQRTAADPLGAERGAGELGLALLWLAMQAALLAALLVWPRRLRAPAEP